MRASSPAWSNARRSSSESPGPLSSATCGRPPQNADGNATALPKAVAQGELRRQEVEQADPVGRTGRSLSSRLTAKFRVQFAPGVEPSGPVHRLRGVRENRDHYRGAIRPPSEGVESPDTPGGHRLGFRNLLAAGLAGSHWLRAESGRSADAHSHNNGRDFGTAGPQLGITFRRRDSWCQRYSLPSVTVTLPPAE